MARGDDRRGTREGDKICFVDLRLDRKQVSTNPHDKTPFISCPVTRDHYRFNPSKEPTERCHDIIHLLCLRPHRHHETPGMN